MIGELVLGRQTIVWRSSQPAVWLENVFAWGAEEGRRVGTN
jgi:hypothetical protein